MADNLSSSLTESILTALAFSEDKRASVLLALNPTLFEEPYSDIAARILEFRKRFGKPPGREHIDDLFDHVLGNPSDRRQNMYIRLLAGMVDQAEGLNIEYIVKRVSSFVRRQTIKSALIEAGELFEQAQTRDDIDIEIEAVLSKALNTKIDDYDAGVFMDDPHRALSFLDEDEGDYLEIGIPELDRRRLCPTRKELILFMAPPGAGKSWWCINLIKRANVQRWKVLYVTLEMSERRAMQRCYQSFFGIAKRGEPYSRLVIDLDDKGKLIGFNDEERTPRRALNQENISRVLRRRMEERGNILHNVLIKEFPSGSLTIPHLEAYLDSIEAVYGFIPDLMIVDYPDLMKLDAKDPRTSVGRHIVDLRGMAQKRNMAVSTPSQTNRESMNARMVRAKMLAADISKIHTCDVGLTFSATDDEKQFGLGRIFVDKGRNDEDKFSVLIEQDYHRGQFVLNSARFPGETYWKQLKAQIGNLAEEESDDADC